MDWVSAFFVYLKSTFPTTDLAYITALGAALTVLLAFFKRVRQVMDAFIFSPVRNFWSTFNSMGRRVAHLESKIADTSEVKARIEKLEEIYSEIQTEIRPNSGKSMKDVINRLDEKMSHICDNSNYLTSQFKKMEALQKSILNSSEVATFETDARGSCIFANKAYLDFVGRPFDEIKNFGWITIIYPDDRARVKAEWESAVADGRHFELSFRVVCKEKIVYSVFCEAVPIIGANEKVTGYIGHYENIEEIGKI
jgi:PAS domain S-box-containing protein